MTPWMWICVFLVASGLLGLGAWLYLRHLAAQKNEAGITVSMGARTTQIGSLVGRNLFGRVRLRIRQIFASHEQKKKLADQYHIRSAAEAAQALGNMKGVFMKLGQILSFASDAIPENARQVLQQLQKDAPPMAFPLARGVVESELGGDLGKFFKHFDENPIAAASIGQVHKARLRDGTAVAVKVQYPGVDVAIENDLKASDRMALVLGPLSPGTDLKGVVRELRDRMLDELDYRQELRNQQLFFDLWKGHPFIRIPRVFPEFSSKRVLCQEFKRGLGFYDFLKQANPKERLLASYVIGDFVFDSMFRYLVYNGDPHPGNYIFHEDGGVSFLDFGCIKYFDRPFMRDLIVFYRAIIEGQKDTFYEYGEKLLLVLPGRPYDKDFMWEVWRYCLEPYATPGGFVFTPEWVAKATQIMDPVRMRQFNLPADMLFFLRITFGLNSISQQLGAAGNFHQAARRYFYVEENNPPALTTLGVKLEPRFLEAAQRPVQRDDPTRPPAAEDSPSAVLKSVEEGAVP